LIDILHVDAIEDVESFETAIQLQSLGEIEEPLQSQVGVIVRSAAIAVPSNIAHAVIEREAVAIHI